MHAYLVILSAVVLEQPDEALRDLCPGHILFLGGQSAAEGYASELRTDHPAARFTVATREVLQFAGTDRVVLVNTRPYGKQP
jgi:hypothetical protein